MADVKPLKLVDHGGGAGRLEEFGAGDLVPAENLPATEWAAETVPQAEAEAGTATTRRAWTAQRVRQAIAAWWNGISSAWGRGFVASADAAAGRTALGLGNAATRTALGTTGALYSRDSILGTVSQSGGVPTGAIIERGSNANGEYVRFADGTQICTAREGGGYTANVNVARAWPSIFSATPFVVCSAIPTGGVDNSFTYYSSTVNWTFASGITSPNVIEAIGVGRWY